LPREEVIFRGQGHSARIQVPLEANVRKGSLEIMAFLGYKLPWDAQRE